jgi:hypothetical protein
MNQIGVECVFSPNGSVQVKRIELNGQWLSVGQGRQWVDGNGRHTLIMLPNNTTREIILRPTTLIWEIVPLPHAPQIF